MISKVIAILLAMEQPQNNAVFGDKGRAIGPLQIHKSVVYDVNRIYGTHYTWRSCKSEKVAKEVCELYLKYWCDPKRLGFKPTTETYLRTWNGGAKGHKRIEATQPYIKKAKAKGLI